MGMAHINIHGPSNYTFTEEEAMMHVLGGNDTDFQHTKGAK